MLRTLLLTVLLVLAAEATTSLAQEQAGSGVKIELLEAGDAPRRPLRFAPRAGARQNVAMTMKLAIESTVDGAKLPSNPVPPQTIMMDTVIRSVGENGDVQFTTTFADIRVGAEGGDPQAAGTMKELVKPMIGASMECLVSERLINKGVDFEVPAGLHPMVKGMMEGMKDSMARASTPVPQEAVGLGGKWRTTQALNANGMKMTQIVINEITELSDSGFAVKVSVTQQAQPQDVKNAMLPAGATMKLKTLSTTGDGASQFRFDSVMAIKSTVKVRSKADMTVEFGGRIQDVATVTEVEFSTAPAEQR